MSDDCTKITIRNFKSFGPEGQTFDLRRLTLMLGANSAGKSSLFQLLLAVRQSIEAQRWFELVPAGSLVDLGRYRNFVHHHDCDAEVSLTLCDPSIGELSLYWAADEQGARGVLRRIEMCKDGFRIRCEPATSVREMRDALATVALRVTRISFPLEGSLAYPPEETQQALRELIEALEPHDFRLKFARLLDSWAFESEVHEYRFAEDSEDEENEENEEDARVRAERQRVERQRIERLLDDTKEALRRTGEVFPKWMSVLRAVRYLGPLRHPGTRVAIHSGDLDADVGSDGQRLTQVLAGNEAVRRRVNSMLETMEIPYRVEVREGLGAQTSNLIEPLLVSSIIREGEQRVECGLPDVGMGIRQVLPVLAAMATAALQASSSLGPSHAPPICFLCVEQPELHLHPRLQLQLMSVAAGVGTPDVSDGRDLATNEGAGERPKGSSLRFVFETHSEHMVLRAQRLIRQGDTKSPEVSMLAVEPKDGVARVTAMQLTKSGDVKGVWPAGFFSERRKEQMGI